MSIDMYVSNSKSQATSVSTMCKQQVEGYESVQKAINDFVLNAPFLTGKAYDSAKSYYSLVLLPLAKGGTLLSEAVEQAVKKFPEDYTAQVDSGDLKQAELEEKIQQADRLLSQVENIRTELMSGDTPALIKTFQLTTNTMMIGLYSNVKKELEEKLHKLLAFNASSPRIFSEISSLQQAVNQGLAQTKTAWSAATGTFVVPSTSELGWAMFIKEFQRNKNNKTEKISGVYLEKGIYGGNQSSPLEAYKDGDSRIADIIKNYYPNMTDKKIKHYLQKLENEGCGYVALVNTFLTYYDGSEKNFEKVFGFPLYNLVNGEKSINYNYLIADLYASQDNHDSEGILFWKKDKINNNEDPSSTEGAGTTATMREYRFENYMKEHSIKVNVINTEGFLGTSSINADIENYDQYHSKGSIIISVSPIKMTDSKGNDYTSNGGHAMTVTGKTKDGKLIVSSWGEKFYINPSDYETKGYRATFQVIDYEK
ncbi:T7SS effector LXG polymorphic toxin [Carnobacterium gallinarum]|uniref:T7SS effector LXG polymorphic toxin n=1 Tax=Carnobacterium gallinarum TaxID=2749 RepID=UPI00069090B2|nr:T7SS effector LXG polymorphic toxin [Carnobacterium gallinarum]